MNKFIDFISNNKNPEEDLLGPLYVSDENHKYKIIKGITNPKTNGNKKEIVGIFNTRTKKIKKIKKIESKGKDSILELLWN